MKSEQAEIHGEFVKRACGTLRPTAAMMAEVTDRLWKFEDFLDEAIMYCE